MKRVACFQCKPENINVQVCGRFRELTKHDLALMLREEVPIYLNALNRNRKGRKSKLTATQKSDLAAEHGQAFEISGISMVLVVQLLVGLIIKSTIT